jgi:hypothetical protein
MFSFVVPKKFAGFKGIAKQALLPTLGKKALTVF